ncbi:putative Fungal-specific transcription factor domain-containing protein [Seiridium cardinale]
MAPHSATAQARTSCHRCHRRKKRCDRKLPQCDNCRSALVSCSFLDDDQQIGSYPIAYVRGLEARVKELEQELLAALARYSGSPQTALPASGSDGQDTEPVISDTVVNEGGGDNFSVSEMIKATQQSGSMPSAGNVPSATLAAELKMLSLEAMAERYLGSSSGLSFARLTQLVLRRLTPDKSDFVFGNESDVDFVQNIIGFSPVDSFDASFLGTGMSGSSPQPLFGGVPLADITDTDPSIANLPLPAKSHIHHLVDFYFAHSHTLYPIILRTDFNHILDRILADPQDPLSQSPLCLFRIWMVLAIGSTTHCSVMMVEESESMLYYSKALEYFEGALGYGDMSALEVIMLQVSYSFFSQLGPNTWFLVGLAARLAVGMGLHTSSTYETLPVDVAEKRKRLFFSIYMMDRVVSMALGRPFALHDDDIDVQVRLKDFTLMPFADADDENIHADGIHPGDPFKPSLMVVPLHILRLRKIASNIAKSVYSNPNSSTMTTDQCNEVIRTLHKDLIDWRRAMPFPLPDSHPRVPHLSSSWFDFNYYTHLAMLYRPTPLLPTLDQSRVETLANAASMAIREAVNMHRQRRLAYNWLNLLSIFKSTLSLIYAITAQPDNLATVLTETKAIDDLELAVELFDTLSGKFVAARKIQRMFEKVVIKYKELRDAE